MEEILHTCRYCTGPGLNYSEAQDGVVKCIYCGNLNDVPSKQPSEELARALSHADHDLFNCRFEEARDSYSEVIAMSPTAPQGYFGRALAKFRIKYLRDERCSTQGNATYQPICYGVTDKLFSHDADYLKALELATPSQRAQYSKQAADIDKIIVNFQQLKARGVDYDVFICCKVTDATGQKTRDSHYAHDLYNFLTQKGLKPFYSERDIRDNFAGSEYEAVILYALYMSESMLVVCSDEDYLDTPWVKNEYSRFLEMTANGYKQTGSLTFVYSGKAIENLPNGKKIQGIDREKAGADDRIVNFVRKFLPEAQAATKFCASCGAEAPAKTKFCPECGSREFFATHDEFVKAQALAQARREQAERDRKHEEEIAALRRQLEESQARNAQEAAETEAEKYLKFKLSDDGKFYWVSKLNDALPTNVVIPEKYKGLPVKGINYFAFACCSSLISITIPNSVTSIEISAFSGCGKLSFITIPNSVTRIGSGAFQNCKGLTSITIPSSVTSIASDAFSGCEKLASITIPDSVTSLGGGAFRNCSGLISITIPNSVTCIDFGAFAGCSSLTSITIPSSVTSIGEGIFAGCYNLEKLEVEPANKAYYSINNCVIEKATKTLVAGCRNSVIPDDGSVTSIGPRAFQNRNSLTSIKLPNGVTSIGKCTFFRTGLTSITIPSSVASIGEGVLSGCNNLRSIQVEQGNKHYYCKNNCLIEKATKTLVAICAGATMPDDGSVTGIGAYTFYFCNNLTSITIPKSITSIGYRAFSYCSSLTSITIPQSITSIDDAAFFDCNKLTFVTIPERFSGELEKIFGKRYQQIQFTFTK